MKSFISKLTILSFFSACVFLASCNKSSESVIIEKEILVDILVDLHIADALLANKGMYDGKLKDTTQSYYNYVLKKYNISRADFDYSLDYYSSNAEEYVHIYDKVIANIDEKMPRKFDPNSIYKLFEDAYSTAEILTDLEKYYGKSGRELWIGRKSAKLPNDSGSLTLKVKKEANYPCLIVFTSEIYLEPKDSSRNLRMELELSYKDSTKTFDTAFFNTDKKKKWQWRRIILKTDSLKVPNMINAQLLAQENDSNISKLQIRQISLRQYAPDKDTNTLPDYSKLQPDNRPVKRNNKAWKKPKRNPKKKTNPGLKNIK